MEQPDVLVVDDETADIELVSAMLSPLGLKLHSALSAEQALAVVAHHELSVALIDLHMPVIGGFDLAARLRSDGRSRTLPIIFFTGQPLDRESVRRGYSLGAVDVIEKPLIPEMLRAKVQVFLDLEPRRRVAELREQLQEYHSRYRAEHSRRNELATALRALDGLQRILRKELSIPVQRLSETVTDLQSHYSALSPPAQRLLTMIGEEVAQVEQVLEDARIITAEQNRSVTEGAERELSPLLTLRRVVETFQVIEKSTRQLRRRGAE